MSPNMRVPAIQLGVLDSEVFLSIHDDGAGFDVQDPVRRKALGILSMEERVGLAGGKFSLRSDLGVGTHIEVRVPLTDPVSEPRR